MEPLEDRRLLAASMICPYVAIDPTMGAGLSHAITGSADPVGYTPQQIRTVYGIDSIQDGSLVGDGTGQTIAIVAVYDSPVLVSSTDANFLSSDLHQFDTAFGLADPPSFRKLDENGGTSYPSVGPAPTGDTLSWEAEEALDVEWAHAVAPQANLVLIESNGPWLADLSTAVNTARNLAGVSVISMSIGWTEDQLTAPQEASLDSMFTTPAGHQGITFVAASGDSGTPGLYPAFSSNVVAVGGTSLTISNDGGYSSETAWGSSGGGQSVNETEPGYQQAVQNSGSRQSPDVAFDGDPNTGVAIYDSYDFGTSSPWVVMGGTSLSTPCWGGLIAIANQLRAAKGLGSLDGPSQTLPGLYALPVNDFHDITGGGNSIVAGVGYDEVTGLGSPVANVLVPDLASLKKAPPLTVTGTTPSLTGGTLTATDTQLAINFSEPVFGGGDAANYELRSLGADGLLGTADDVVIPLSVHYSGATADLSFSALPQNVYRLTVYDAVTSTRGKKLDGNGDGSPGGDWVTDFVVVPGGVFSSATVPTFSTGSPASASDIVAGDFNGDGKQDLAVALGGDSTGVGLLLNNGSGGFTFKSTDIAWYGDGGLACIAAADFNGDGKLDLVTGWSGNGLGVQVWLGHGDGTFPPSYAGPTFQDKNAECSCIRVGDFNGDGIPDFVVGNLTDWLPSDPVKVYLGHGDGTFSVSTIALGGRAPRSIAVGDFNGDGKQDLAVTMVNPAEDASDSSELAILLGNGDGTFSAPAVFDSGDNCLPTAVTVGDFNGDGKLDLMQANLQVDCI